MGKKINEKCMACSKIPREKFQANYPECYDFCNCRHKRSYYRDYEKNKLKQHKWHVWLKFRGTECFVCGSKENLECHHIEARQVSMKDTAENVVTLCHACHKVLTIFERKLGVTVREKPMWMLAKEKWPQYSPKTEPELSSEEYKAMVLGNPSQ